MYISFIAHSFVATCAQGFMSNKGRSLTFDATANGWVKGEGLAVVAMQKLGEVVDGKTVVDPDKPYLGTIAGGVVGHVGTTSSFNAPSGPIEQELIHGAVRQAQVAPHDIDCVEACGDGRALYDAVEAMALSNALRLNESNPLVLCAVKTCVGMQHETAGMSQLIRALYNLRLGIHAPSNHLIEMNPHIDIWPEDGDCERPMSFATESMPVKGKTNFAGMTARAHGGTLSHVVVTCDIDEKKRPSAARESDSYCSSAGSGCAM
jgi:acyl transferase domain-containing protein